MTGDHATSLAAICAGKVPTYHIGDAGGVDPEAGTIHFRHDGVQHIEETKSAWLPTAGPLRIGVTAGASTPNNKIGEAVGRIPTVEAEYVAEDRAPARAMEECAAVCRMHKRIPFGNAVIGQGSDAQTACEGAAWGS